MRSLLLIMAVVISVGVTGLSSVSSSPPRERSSSLQEPRKQTTSEFEVKGRVINAAGEAVAGAKVFVDADGPTAASIPTDVSDKDGNFSVEIRELGNYTVYGSKEEDGYPLTVSGFHQQVPFDQIPKLHITERKTVENVILQLGRSAATIEGSVKDVLNNRSVRTATITLRRADNPDLLYQTSTDAANPGEFKIVVPTEPFTMTVESAGYQPWTYGDDGIPGRMPRLIKLNRGELRKLQVGLRKEPQ